RSRVRHACRRTGYGLSCRQIGRAARFRMGRRRTRLHRGQGTQRRPDDGLAATVAAAAELKRTPRRMSGFRLRTATWNDREFCWWLMQQTMKPYIAATWGWNDAEQLIRFEAEFDPASRQIVEFDGRAIGVLPSNYGS